MSKPEDIQIDDKTADQVWDSLGPDYTAGWKARHAGDVLDLNQSVEWKMGWRECDDEILRVT